MMLELGHTIKVGFDENSSLIELLVEKDFTCLDNAEEDQSDNYPNPLPQKTALLWLSVYEHFKECLKY